MKPRLVILSDLWGKEKSDWISNYSELLNDKFEIQYYDCCELAEIDKNNYTQEILHHEFVNGGIEKAVDHLLKLEKDQIDVLTFSVGGTIAWKAALKGLNVSRLFAVSSTRLRLENETPNCKIKLYYGELDLNVPKGKWFEDLKLTNQIFEKQEHEFYLEEKNAIVICNAVLKASD